MESDGTPDLSWMQRTILSPSAAVADGYDALWAAGVGVLVLAELAVPAAAMYLLIRASGAATHARDTLLAYAAVVIYVAVASRVRWLQVNRVGLTFGRTLGRPRVLRWEQITDVRPATRREVVVHGWLWPPLIPREATTTMSSLGHYRIAYRGGYCFFPPANVPEFLGALDYWRERSRAEYPPFARETLAGGGQPITADSGRTL